MRRDAWSASAGITTDRTVVNIHQVVAGCRTPPHRPTPRSSVGLAVSVHTDLHCCGPLLPVYCIGLIVEFEVVVAELAHIPEDYLVVDGVQFTSHWLQQIDTGHTGLQVAVCGTLEAAVHDPTSELDSHNHIRGIIGCESQPRDRPHVEFHIMPAVCVPDFIVDIQISDGRSSVLIDHVVDLEPVQLNSGGEQHEIRLLHQEYTHGVLEEMCLPHVSENVVGTGSSWEVSC